MDWLFRFADPSIDWNYAMVTLVVRFIGVFVVMAVVQVALQASSLVIHRIEARTAAPAQVEAQEVVSLDLSAIAAGDAETDGATVAAIALALALDEQKGRAAVAPPSTGRPSAWAIAGRMRSLR